MRIVEADDVRHPTWIITAIKEYGSRRVPLFDLFTQLSKLLFSPGPVAILHTFIFNAINHDRRMISQFTNKPLQVSCRIFKKQITPIIVLDHVRSVNGRFSHHQHTDSIANIIIPFRKHIRMKANCIDIQFPQLIQSLRQLSGRKRVAADRSCKKVYSLTVQVQVVTLYSNCPKPKGGLLLIVVSRRLNNQPVHLRIFRLPNLQPRRIKCDFKSSVLTCQNSLFFCP